MNNDKPPQNDEPNPSNVHPDPVHPNENPGLADELKERLGSDQFSEGSSTLDNTDEHRAAVGELVGIKEGHDNAAAERARLREQALRKLSSTSGVVLANQSQIEQKMAEIEQEESGQN